jgi:hypothetical protein
MEPAVFQATRAELGGNGVVLSAAQTWPNDETTVESDYIDTNIERLKEKVEGVETAQFLSVRRYLGFWALAQQRLTAVEEEPLNRTQSRRAARAKLPVKPVRVIRLREQIRDTEPASHQPVDWSEWG